MLRVVIALLVMFLPIGAKAHLSSGRRIQRCHFAGRPDPGIFRSV